MDAFTSALAASGPIGLVLGFVMLRLESRMTRLERSLDRLTRAFLIEQLMKPQTMVQAERILAELDAKAQG